MVAAAQRGDALPSTAPPRPLHTLLRCVTPEDRTPGSRARGAVSGVPPGRNEGLSIVEARHDAHTVDSSASR
jgi:hypothetical protein